MRIYLMIPAMFALAGCAGVADLTGISVATQECALARFLAMQQATPDAPLFDMAQEAAVTCLVEAGMTERAADAVAPQIATGIVPETAE